MYEVSPDYGMFVQAWNLYSFTQPVVAQFFGVHPNAYEKKVSIGVQMPSTWQQASLEDVMVGNNTLSIRFEIAKGVQKVSVLSTKPDWQITFLPIEGYDLSLKTENLPKGVTKFTAIYE
jgi:hypothetical protein